MKRYCHCVYKTTGIFNSEQLMFIKDPEWVRADIPVNMKVFSILRSSFRTPLKMQLMTKNFDSILSDFSGYTFEINTLGDQYG